MFDHYDAPNLEVKLSLPGKDIAQVMTLHNKKHSELLEQVIKDEVAKFDLEPLMRAEVQKAMDRMMRESVKNALQSVFFDRGNLDEDGQFKPNPLRKEFEKAVEYEVTRRLKSWRLE